MPGEHEEGSSVSKISNTDRPLLYLPSALLLLFLIKDDMEGISVDSSALFVDSSAKDDVEGSEGEAAFLSADDADGGWRGTVTHALMAHEDATAAEDASSLEAARLKHLGASKNFLAAAEDCCEESTKRSLLLLSHFTLVWFHFHFGCSRIISTSM